MFSGIHTMLFGKKHHKTRQDDSGGDKPQGSADDFVILERRHSGDFDRNSGIYPNLDPSQPPPSNLPYAVSPSLPNLKDATSSPQSGKDEGKVEMLQGVPFVLSSQILLLSEDCNKGFVKMIKNFDDIKEYGEESLLETFNYDFELEHSVSSEFASSD